MKWIEILRKGNIVLLQNEGDTQFVVAFNYDPTGTEDNQWSHGHYFEYWTKGAVSLYVEDLIVDNLGLKQSRKAEGTRLVSIEKKTA